jgi:hypothetical protein
VDSCGCFVVSTAVGGVPEVLPRHMIRFAEPSAADLVEAISDAITLVSRRERGGGGGAAAPCVTAAGPPPPHPPPTPPTPVACPQCRKVDPLSFHAELREMYNWPEVAERTALVYERVAAEPHVPLVERFRRFFGVGRVFGPLAVIAMALFHFMVTLLDWVAPVEDVDIVPDVPYHTMDEREAPERLRFDYGGIARPNAVAPPPVPAKPAPQHDWSPGARQLYANMSHLVGAEAAATMWDASQGYRSPLPTHLVPRPPPPVALTPASGGVGGLTVDTDAGAEGGSSGSKATPTVGGVGGFSSPRTGGAGRTGAATAAVVAEMSRSLQRSMASRAQMADRSTSFSSADSGNGGSASASASSGGGGGVVPGGAQALQRADRGTSDGSARSSGSGASSGPTSRLAVSVADVAAEAGEVGFAGVSPQPSPSTALGRAAVGAVDIGISLDGGDVTVGGGAVGAGSEEEALDEDFGGGAGGGGVGAGSAPSSAGMRRGGHGIAVATASDLLSRLRIRTHADTAADGTIQATPMATTDGDAVEGFTPSEQGAGQAGQFFGAGAVARGVGGSGRGASAGEGAVARSGYVVDADAGAGGGGGDRVVGVATHAAVARVRGITGGSSSGGGGSLGGSASPGDRAGSAGSGGR